MVGLVHGRRHFSICTFVCMCEHMFVHVYICTLRFSEENHFSASMKTSLAPFYFFTLALKETSNSTNQPKKNENYNAVLEKPFIFNLQTVSTARRRCRSSMSRPDVVGCGREVAERVKKTTSVPETKKKVELPMKLHEDPKIPPARQDPRRPHHSHKLLDVAVEMGLKPGRLYWKRRRRHHLSPAPPSLNPKNTKTEPSRRLGSRSTPLPWSKDHIIEMDPRRHCR